MVMSNSKNMCNNIFSVSRCRSIGSVLGLFMIYILICYTIVYAYFSRTKYFKLNDPTSSQVKFPPKKGTYEEINRRKFENHLQSYHRYASLNQTHSNLTFTQRIEMILKTRLAKRSPYRFDRRIFYYHARKSGGTSIERTFKVLSMFRKYDFIVMEGITLDHRFLNLPRTLSMISFRNPIERIVSLYWYEHVQFWYGKLGKNRTNCRNFHDWIEGWRDGSEFKNKILESNPNSNYVEVENYFIKSLIGYNRTSSNIKIGEIEFQQAKLVLNKIDIILICEWLSETSQQDYIMKMCPKMSKIFVNFKTLTRDTKLANELEPMLMPNKDRILGVLRDINSWDVKLWQYACELARKRFATKEVLLKMEMFSSNDPSNQTEKILTNELKANLGVKRPDLHKGP